MIDISATEGGIGNNTTIINSNDKDNSHHTHDASSHFQQIIESHIQSLTHRLREISISIHDNPELRYKELHAHEVLTNFIEEQRGWQVTKSAYGIATAFAATFDGGRDGPVVSFNAEYGAFSRLTLQWVQLQANSIMIADS